MNRIANTTVVKRLALASIVLAGLSGAFSPALRVGAQPPITGPVNGIRAGVDDPSDGNEVNSASNEATSNAITASQVGLRAVGTITGQGTTGRIPKFTGTNTIGNSVMFESTGKIGIGTTSPGFPLTVAGSTSAIVRGINNSTASANSGVYGSSAGSGWGVYGFAPSGRGLFAQSTSGFGAFATSSSGYGVFGSHAATSGTNPGVQGETNSTAASANGVVGRVVSTAAGANSAGVRGINNGTGGNGMGVYGSHAGGGNGVHGTSVSGDGVYGTNSSGTTGAAVHGVTTATDGNGVIGEANNGSEAFAIWGKSTSGEAGHFTGRVVVNGDLDVLGNLTKDSGTFKMDHPLDPANKYLSHSFVESPDMMNIYNGNTTLDGNGKATVQLPNYFGALNKDFRYQLTAIGAPGPNLYIAQEIRNNRFKVAGGKPGMKISWQVTGIRQDAYAKAHRIAVETVKPVKERGYYLHPELLGQPAEKGIAWARYPKLMRQSKVEGE